MSAPTKANTQHGLGATLADTVARVAPLVEWAELSFGVPAEPQYDWWNCADLLAEPARFGAWRKTLAEWLEATYGDAPERTTAGYIMDWYLLVPAFLAGLLFHSARRVPSLRPRDIAFRISPAERPHPVGIALLSNEFACLPDDVGNCRPEATTVANERALAALLRARYAAHAAQFVASFGPTVRQGRRMLWATATDSLDKGTWLAGRYCGNEGLGVADATLLLPAKLRPFTSASTLHPNPDPNAKLGWTRQRQSCCFQFAIGGNEPACKTCPRRRTR